MKAAFIFLIIFLILITTIISSNCFGGWNVRFCLFVATMFSFVNVVTIGFALAVAQMFALTNICILLFFEIIGGTVWGICKKKLKIPKTHFFERINYVFLIFLLAILMLYMCFPTYYMWGRRDPSVYFLMGTNIARNGGLELPLNDFIDAHYGELEDFVDVSFRGFYSDYSFQDSEVPSKLTVQFAHYFSAALAIGYSTFGLEGLVRVPGIIGALCSLAMYYFVKSLNDNKKMATAAAVLLSLCPAQIWGARITQTEELYQLYVLLGAMLYVYAIRHSSSRCIVLCGCILGMIELNRIDGLLVGIAVYLCCIYMNLFYPNRHLYNLFSISYTTVAAFGLAMDVHTSKYYIMAHGPGMLYPLISLNVLLFMLVGVSYACGRRGKFRKTNYVAQMLDSRLFKGVFCASVIVLCKFLYCIRPSFQMGHNVDYDFWQRCFVEMFFYIPIYAVPFMILGSLFLMKDQRIRIESLLFSACGIVSSALYIYKPNIASDHIWASRRWVSVVFPFFIFLAVMGIECFSSAVKKTFKKLHLYVYPACVLGIVTFMIWQSKSFLFERLLEDMVEDYSELVDNIEDDKVYFAQYSHFASYLRLYYEKNVFVLNENQKNAFYDYVKSSDMPVYYIGDIEMLGEGFLYDVVYSGTVEGYYFDQQRRIYTNELSVTGGVTNIYKLYIEETDG